jgi:hypothetical protein
VDNAVGIRAYCGFPDSGYPCGLICDSLPA